MFKIRRFCEENFHIKKSVNQKVGGISNIPTDFKHTSIPYSIKNGQNGAKIQ